MKHFFFGLCVAVVLIFGPVRVACAQHWWRQTGPGPMGAGADRINWASSWNVKLAWPHIRKASLEKPTPLYTTPKSVGWWHKGPGPAGAGSGN